MDSMDPPPAPRHPMSLLSLQHEVAGADTVTVRKDLVPLAGGPAIDLHEPIDAAGAPRPWVLFVNGLSDVGARRILGCAIKDMASYESWGRAMAASGIVGIAHGYMLDLDGADGVAKAQRTWRFANPVAGRGVGDLAPVPMLVVRAGRDDNPHLNASIDAFAAHALAGNVPLTLTNYPDGLHAVDLTDATAAAGRVVTQILDFLRLQLIA